MSETTHDTFDVLDAVCSDLERGSIRPEFCQDSPLSFLSAGKEYIKERDNNLDFHSGIVAAQFNYWQTTGEHPAPYYAGRISIILRKLQDEIRETRFLKIYLHYFPEEVGSTVKELKERAWKLGIEEG